MSGGTSIAAVGVDRGSPQPLLELDAGSASRREWIGSLWDHRGVIWVLSRKDFQARYKRASLGVLWAVSVPLLQAVVMIVVFSHFIRVHTGISYAAFVLSGILTWSYVALVVPQATTAIVDGTALTDKLWFPRAILSIVPCLSNLVGLGISMCILLIAVPVLGVDPGLHLLLLVPACLLLVVFLMSLTMVLSAMNVYFRDVRFIVLAALTVWMYSTPIMYPKSAVGSLGQWLDFNPMTGIISLFHIAVAGQDGSWTRALLVSLLTTGVLLVAAIEVHRRHDRLFVDLL